MTLLSKVNEESLFLLVGIILKYQYTHLSCSYRKPNNFQVYPFVTLNIEDHTMFYREHTIHIPTMNA